MVDDRVKQVDVYAFGGLDRLLNDQERAWQGVVRTYASEELEPHVADDFEEGLFRRGLASELGRLGVLGMHLDGYGCGGSSAVEYGIACQELEAVDSGLRSFVSVQGSLAMFAIHRWGSEEQKEHYLPAMAAGELVGCFGLTEPDAGSNPAEMRTGARRDGKDWILSGTKTWITNGSIADVAIVWARTDEGVRGFVVDTDLEGFTGRPMGRKLSLRASDTGELVLDDVRVGPGAELPGAYGLRGPLTCLDEARFGIVWGTAGAARACLSAALEYASTREQFGGPIARFQLVQRKLVEMSERVIHAQLLAIHLGRLKDAGELMPEQVSLGKLSNARAALDVARTSRSVLGANGISLEYPVIRHMTNLESVVTYEGTEEIHTLAIGRALTRHAAFA